MPIKPLRRKDGRIDGVFAYTSGYPVRNGQPSNTLERIKQNFPVSKGFARAHAKQWLHDEEAKRFAIEHERRFGDPVAALDDPTIEEMVEHFLQHKSFLKLEQSSQDRIGRILQRRFVVWNAFRGRPRASMWTQTVAQRYIDDVRNGYQDGSGKRHKGHIGQGANLQLIYAKKVFTVWLMREEPSALKKNPWPSFEVTKSEEENYDPNPYSDAALDALFAHMVGYEYPLFSALYNAGVRSEELLKLTKDRIEFADRFGVRTPVRIRLTKTKNHRKRWVTLTPQGQVAINDLLNDSDDSEFLVRRDFVFRSSGARIKTPLLDALWRIKKRTVKTHPELRHELFDRIGPVIEGERPPRFITCVHSFRATFVTNLHASGVSVETIAQLIGDSIATLSRYLGVKQDVHDAAVLKLRPHGGFRSLATQGAAQEAPEATFEDSPEYLAWKLRTSRGHGGGHPLMNARVNSREIDTTNNSASA